MRTEVQKKITHFVQLESRQIAEFFMISTSLFEMAEIPRHNKSLFHSVLYVA